MKEIYLNQSGYGIHRGVTPQRIYKLIKDGQLPKSCYKKIGRRRLINVRMADQALADNLSKLNGFYEPAQQLAAIKKQGKKVPSPKIGKKISSPKIGKKISFPEEKTIAEYRRLYAQYSAALIKLEYKQKLKLLVPAAQVDNDYKILSCQVRTAVLKVPEQISKELAALTDQHKISQILTQKFNAVLEKLSESK